MRKWENCSRCGMLTAELFPIKSHHSGSRNLEMTLHQRIILREKLRICGSCWRAICHSTKIRNMVLKLKSGD